jgi:hypothetical protein
MVDIMGNKVTKSWPNPTYADSLDSPAPMAFCDPPTRANIVRAHQLVAQSLLGLAWLGGAQALVALPGIFQVALGLVFDSVVNVFGMSCLASALCGYVLAFRIMLKTWLSPEIQVALKLAARPKLTGRALAFYVAGIVPTACIFGLWLVGCLGLFAHYNVPRFAVSIVEVATALSCTGVFVSLAFGHMKWALDSAVSDVDTLK